jgi:hypothetical protein
MILDIRSNTRLSSEDTYFIKPKDSQLDLQQSSLGALTATIDFRDQKSSTNTQCSDKKGEEQKELQNST